MQSAATCVFRTLWINEHLARQARFCKNDYAQMIYDRSEFAENFDFSRFEQVFQVIRKIIILP